MTKERKAQFVFIGILFMCVLLVWIFYSLFGRQLIDIMYEGRCIGFLNKIIEGQATYPVKYYYAMVDRLFLGCLLAMIFAILTSFGLRKYSGYVFYGLVACYVLYCIIFIAKMSFINNGVRYFTLFDDAMISMKYAKNLAHGYGLIWNPHGAAIEGYTNYLWTIYMAFWHLFPISIAKMALLIQISGLLLLVSSLFLVTKIADYISDGNKYVSISAVLLTASYLPINFWALRGMETSLLEFILLLAIWRFFKCLKEGTFDPALFIILGIGMLTRADFPFLYVAITSFIIVTEPKSRKKNFLFAVFIFLLVVGGHTLFRWLYYRDFFPNTYYLKVTGVPIMLRVQRGLYAAAKFIQTTSPVLFIAPFIYAVLNRKNVKVLFLLYVFTLQLLYSIYVGGDAWEWWGHFANRYLCIVMPIFFILTALSINYLLETVISYIKKNTHLNVYSWIRDFCFIIVLLLIVFQIHGGLKNRSLIRRQLLGLSLIEVADDGKMVETGLMLKAITTPDAKIAVVWAGSIPYFSDRFCVDLLGKNDVFISRLPARVKTYQDFHPGHDKYDYAYSIGKLRPDIVAQLFKNPEEADPWLSKYYQTAEVNGTSMYFRKDSKNILWAKVSREFTDK